MLLRTCLAGFLLLAGCTPPPGMRPDLPPNAPTGTVLVYREHSLWTPAPALFGEGGKEYLGLKGGEYGTIEIAAGIHRFETWAYFGWREEWRPHATLSLPIEPHTRTCIKTHAKGPLLIGFDGLSSFVEAMIRPFRSAYEMAVVPCTAEGPPAGYQRAGGNREGSDSSHAPAPASPAQPASPTPKAGVPPPAPVFSAGQRATLFGNAMLRRQPRSASEAVDGSHPTSITLKAQLQNAEGRWWYVTADGTSGWVRESDLRTGGP